MNETTLLFIGKCEHGYPFEDGFMHTEECYVPVEPETLYRLNVSPGPGGGSCVLCGGSVQAVQAVPVDAALGIGGDE